MTGMGWDGDPATFDPNLIGRCPHPNKKGFPTRDAAEQHLIDHGWLGQCAYRCGCGAWHNGHPPPERRGVRFRELQQRIRESGGEVVIVEGSHRVRPTPRHRRAS